MIPFSDVSLVAVVIATIANIAVGFLWYSPALFAKRWQKLMNFSEKDVMTGMGQAMAVAFTATLLCTYVIAVIMAIIMPNSLTEALVVTCLFWFAFTMPAHLGRIAWEKGTWELFWINSLQALASVLAAVTVLFFLS